MLTGSDKYHLARDGNLVFKTITVADAGKYEVKVSSETTVQSPVITVSVGESGK